MFLVHASYMIDNPMSWATFLIQSLKQGKTIRFRPRGQSMQGKIESGQLCTVEPIQNFMELQVGDIVLCKVQGAHYLHQISAMRDGQFQISNNRGYVNGWVRRESIYGKCIKIEK